MSDVDLEPVPRMPLTPTIKTIPVLSRLKVLLPVRPSPALAFRSDSAPRLPPCPPCSASPPPVGSFGFQALPASLGCQG